MATLKKDFDEILKLTQQLEDKLSSFRIKLSNKNTDIARSFVGDPLYSYRKDYLKSLLTFKNRHYNKLGENKMTKKKKQNLDEGMVMISSLLPVGGLIGMPPKRVDNFEFKGLPGQFDKDGNKILDEMGQPVEKKEVVKEAVMDAKYYKNLLADVEDGLSELVAVGEDYEIFQSAKYAKKALKQAYKLVNSVK